MDRKQGEVWVFAEQEEGRLSEVPFELLGKGRELADRLQYLRNLAQRREEGFIPLKDIAESEGISRKYLESIMTILSKADFVDASHGKNGGSSRLLQERIYYHSLLSGADYMAEEWGLNCSYTAMEDFTLSDYGRVKKDFINTALDFRGICADVPFAIVFAS